MGSLGFCAADFDPVPATTTVRFSFGDSRYKIAVCEQHANAIQRDMLKWARMSEVDEHITFRSRLNPEDLGPVKRSHVPFPVVKTGEVISFDEELQEIKPPPPKPRAPRVHRRYDPTLPINFDRWGITAHARERAAERQVSTNEIYWAAEQPDTTRPATDPKYPGLQVRIRGHVHVVVNPTTYEVVTVVNRSLADEGYQNAARSTR